MDVKDFLPKYPIVHIAEFPVLDPYENLSFDEAIFHKKEFYENRLERTEEFPREKGILMKYQKTIARYMSSHTPYDRLLMVHAMGLGKCVLPGTEITIQSPNFFNTIMIENIWKKYASPGIVFDDKGEWTSPSVPLLTQSYDAERNTFILSKIESIYRQYINEPIRKITIEGRSTLTTTRAHKILTERGWQADLSNCKFVAKKVEEATSATGLYFFRIEKIEEYIYNGWVYDLEISQHHNYIANGIVTHNTCSAIGAIEQIKSEESAFDGALILAKGASILDNFVKELIEKCTPGQYIPENYYKLTDMEKIHRIKKKIKFYQLRTFAKFAKKISKMIDQDIIDNFSNKIIVIDEAHNLRIQSDKNYGESLETYQQFHRFLHTVKNCKILLLSGTPMKDGPEEIASISNLLLPLDEQLPTGSEFLEQFTTENKGVYLLKPEKIQEIKNKLKGMVSFLREAESTVPKEFIGKKKFGGLKHFIVAPNTMSAFQSTGYKIASDRDGSGKKGVYINSREASLFVYPDGSFGRDGFQQYITLQSEKTSKLVGKDRKARIGVYKMTHKLRSALEGKTDKETLEKVRRHSATYAQVIEQILETRGNCFIYSSLAKGSGGILFSLILELFGFTRGNGREKTMGLRYSILTNKTASASDMRRINNRFNHPDNMYGEYIKVIIGSKAVSEGFSFRNVIFESVNTPHWNYSETAQALARGIRLGSHNDLLKDGKTPVVRILQPVSMPEKAESTPPISVDLLMYKTSEDKDISIKRILRLLMEIAFDCALNYLRNHVDGKDSSRECDYTVCNYSCDGVNLQAIRQGLDESELDYSTYQLFYSDPKIPLIRKRIEQLFRTNVKIDLNSIINNLQNQFTEEEIRNALHAIQEDTGKEEFDYRTFLDIYSRTPAKKIMNIVEDLFREHFRLNLDTIVEFTEGYTRFEILTVLHNIINDSIPLTNKYGFQSYLREENNVYFLVNSLSVEADFFAEYYTKYPHITREENFSKIINKIYSSSLPTLIEKLCRTTDTKEFSSLMKTLPPEIHKLFIEASLIAEDKKIKAGANLRLSVLEFFKSYIKRVGKMWIFSDEQNGVLRCLKSGSNSPEWKDCPEKYKIKLKQSELEKAQKLRQDNPYGIMGTYNPENGAFCITDFRREKEAKTKLSEKKKIKDTDRRLSYSGKVCGAGGWKLADLMDIMINRLKVDPPNTFLPDESEIKMLAKINQDKNLAALLSEESDKKNYYRRMLYWGTMKKDGGNKGIKPICEAMKIWFEKNGLLEIDNRCGVQGKKKITLVKQPVKQTFRIEAIIPRKQEEKFKAYNKDITRLMFDCFELKKYSPPIDDNTWIMVFYRRKLVGFLMIDTNNILWNVCVSKSYRRQGIAKKAMTEALTYACSIRDKSPTLQVDNRGKDKKKLIQMYISFGFEVIRSDDRYTYMKHECKKE